MSSQKRRGSKVLGILGGALMLVLLVVLLPIPSRTPTALAGPPNPTVVVQVKKEGGEGGGGEDGSEGNTGTGQEGAATTPDSGAVEWTQYDEAPISPDGVVTSSPYYYQGQVQGDEGSWWPPDIGAPLEWIGQQLNPGKWVVDSLQGGLVTLGKGIVTSETWIILFFMGRSQEVTEAYQAKMEWQESGGEPPPESAPFEVPDFKGFDSGSWNEEGDYIGRNVVVYTPIALTWKNDTVATLWRSGLFFTLGLLILVMIYGGFKVMVSGTAPGRQSPSDFLVRALSAGFLAVLTMPIWALAIKVCNLLSEAVAPPTEEILIFQQTVGAAQSVPAVLEGIIAGGVFLLVFLAVVGIMLIRLGLLCFLIVVGPLAIMAWVLPGSRPWFERWIRLAWGVLLLQPVLMLTLRIGMFLMQLPLSIVGLDPQAIGTAEAPPIPHFVIMVAEPLVGIAMLVVCFRLTGMLMSASGGGAAGGVLGLGGVIQEKRRERAVMDEARSSYRSQRAGGGGGGNFGAAAAGGALMLAAASANAGAAGGTGEMGDTGGAALPAATGGSSGIAGPSAPVAQRAPRMPRAAAAGGGPQGRSSIGSTAAAVGKDAAMLSLMGLPPQAAAALAAARNAEQVGGMLGLSPAVAAKIGTVARTATGVVMAGRAAGAVGAAGGAAGAAGAAGSAAAGGVGAAGSAARAAAAAPTPAQPAAAAPLPAAPTPATPPPATPAAAAPTPATPAAAAPTPATPVAVPPPPAAPAAAAPTPPPAVPAAAAPTPPSAQPASAAPTPPPAQPAAAAPLPAVPMPAQPAAAAPTPAAPMPALPVSDGPAPLPAGKPRKRTRRAPPNEPPTEGGATSGQE